VTAEFLLIALASVMFALAGVLLSALSTLGHAVPCPAEKVSMHVGVGAVRRGKGGQHPHGRDLQSTSQRSEVYFRGRALSSADRSDSTDTFLQSTTSIHVRFTETHTVYSYSRPTRTPSQKDLTVLEDEAPTAAHESGAGKGPIRSLTLDEHKPRRGSPVRRFTDVLEQCQRTSPVLQALRQEHDEMKARIQTLTRPKICRTATVPQGGVVKAEDRLVRKEHSLPLKKNSQPTLRTDPYQAPYFFPLPGSPEAASYVRNARTARTSPKYNPNLDKRVESAQMQTGNTPRTPIQTTDDEPHIGIVTPAVDVARPKKTARTWSWHLPRPRSRRSSFADADRATDRGLTPSSPSPTKEPPPIPSRGDGDDLVLTVSSPPIQTALASSPPSGTRKLPWRARLHRRSSSMSRSDTHN